MKLGFVLVAISIAGCATHSRPEYEAITNFSPDCKNEAAQIRYLNKLKQFPAHAGDVADAKYNQTIDIQIERLKVYCRDE